MHGVQSTSGKLPVGKDLAGKTPEGIVPCRQNKGVQNAYSQITVCIVQLVKYPWADYFTVKRPVINILECKIRLPMHMVCKVLHVQLDL